jgi:hypothetical protein
MLRFAVLAATVSLAACSARPGESSLRDSFAAQLTANRWAKNVARTGDDLRFAGPGVEGKDQSIWRVHIDAALVEDNDDAAHPYKGTVRSSWYADEVQVKPRGRDSNLPIGLQSNGLAQECWAFWDAAAKRWSWE